MLLVSKTSWCLATPPPQCYLSNTTHTTHNATHTTHAHSPERKEDVTYASNFLVFGHGPHYCVGKEYAINHLMTFLAIVSTAADWKR